MLHRRLELFSLSAGERGARELEDVHMSRPFLSRPERIDPDVWPIGTDARPAVSALDRAGWGGGCLLDRAIELDEHLLAEKGSDSLVEIGQARKAPEPLTHAPSRARSQQRPWDDDEAVEGNIGPRKRRRVTCVAEDLRKAILFGVQRGPQLFAPAGALEDFPEPAPRTRKCKEA